MIETGRSRAIDGIVLAVLAAVTCSCATAPAEDRKSMG